MSRLRALLGGLAAASVLTAVALSGVLSVSTGIATASTSRVASLDVIQACITCGLTQNGE